MAIYPNYTAGQRLTAANLAAGQFMVVYKSSNTDRASTTTLANDPDLTFTLAANAVYTVEFYLHYAGALTPGEIRTAWTVPSGTSGNRGVHGPGSSATSDDNISTRSGVHGYATTVEYGVRSSGATNQQLAIEESLVTTSAAGTCAIQWAQALSSATATRMAAGSWARCLRIS